MLAKWEYPGAAEAAGAHPQAQCTLAGHPQARARPSFSKGALSAEACFAHLWNRPEVPRN